MTIYDKSISEDLSQTYYNLTLSQMSLFIQMPQPAIETNKDPIIHLLSQQVTALLYHPEFNAAIIMQQSQKNIEIALQRGQLSFIRDTRWKIDILQSHLKFTVSFLDFTGINPLRAQSERVKLELIIILKLINNRLPIEQQYFVEPTTGVLRYSFKIAHQDYQQKLKGIDSLRKLFKYILSQLHLYAEIILFCQPANPSTKLQFSGISELEAVNRYRFLLRNTRKVREAGLTYITNIIEIKDQLKQNPRDENLKRQLTQIRYMFQSNIEIFEQMRCGLEPQQKTYERLSACIKHIYKNSKGEQSHPPQSKIVNGIKVLRSADIRILSNQGAHSQILKGKFIYKLSATINLQVAQSNALWLDGRQLKSQLIIKKCKISQNSSINSFLNQLYFLNHIRDAKSSYIAKYYLDIKNFQDRKETDMIYMRPYYQNLYGIIKKCLTLSMLQRLNISYKISKGLCFLNYWSVLHRDFKPHNIMVDQNFNPVIIDFGSCAPIYHSGSFQVHQQRLLTTRMFHIYYHELPQDYAYLRNKFTREEYNRHPLFDVYSFGRVLSFIFFNSITPPSPDDLNAYPYPELLKNVLFLITLCLQVDPDQRPAFSEATSFLGTLSCYAKSLEIEIDKRSRSFSEPKPSSQELD